MEAPPGSNLEASLAFGARRKKNHRASRPRILINEFSANFGWHRNGVLRRRRGVNGMMRGFGWLPHSDSDDAKLADENLDRIG